MNPRTVLSDMLCNQVMVNTSRLLDIIEQQTVADISEIFILGVS